MTQELWIARDKDGGLYLYNNKPTLDYDKRFWFELDDDGQYILQQLDRTLFPEVTFENSPQKVKLTLVKEE